MKQATILILLGTLTACSAPANPETASVTGSGLGATPAPSAIEVGAGDQPVSSTTVVLAQRCAEAELQLSCSQFAGAAETLDCRNTSLSLETADGQSSKINKPAEIADYTAVGIGCAAANDGTAYFVVEYGQLPFGCEFCEWHYLYDQNGQQLTHSKPPVLDDTSLPGDDRQQPNNREFTTLQKQLGLSDPGINFVTCDVRVDEHGEPACLKEHGHADK